MGLYGLSPHWLPPKLYLHRLDWIANRSFINRGHKGSV